MDDAATTGGATTRGADLAGAYRSYLGCLDARDLGHLGEHVAEDVRHDGRDLGLDGYRAMLREDFAAIPDLRFEAEQVVVEGDALAARLVFDCHPVGDFRGVRVDGRRVVFHEHALYRWAAGRIVDVRSIVDVDAVRRQVADGT